MDIVKTINIHLRKPLVRHTAGRVRILCNTHKKRRAHCVYSVDK